MSDNKEGQKRREQKHTQAHTLYYSAGRGEEMTMGHIIKGVCWTESRRLT